MSRWDDSGTWVGHDLRREVFFFSSAGAELYGSTYAAASPTSSLGVVICNSWGFEGNQAARIVHPVSIAVAKAGGVAINFHYPGFGDSHGGEGADMDGLAGAAVDAVRAASLRHPGRRWVLAGLMLGASVACLAADRGAEIEQLLLVQPALRPGPYFARLERASKRSFGTPASAPAQAPGFAYGYRLAPSLLESAPLADTAVEAALARFAGGGAIVRYAKPDPVEEAPQRFEQFCAPGVWRFGSRDNPALTRATAECLRARVKAVA